MSNQKKVTGVILAGGLARRMGGQDKGLINYQGRLMIEYALEAMTSVVVDTVINANRNHMQYQKFGYPVIADQTDSFDGPLAGVLSVMIATDADILLVMPCDSPRITSAHLQRMLTTRAAADADIAVAFDGIRLHPVFLALKTSLLPSLQTFLSSGQRKIDIWLQQHNLVQVDFADSPQVFLNVNSLQDLIELEPPGNE